MRMPRHFYKTKHDPKRGPARIYATINKYFTSTNWHTMWKKFEGTTPMFFFVIRRPSGMVEKVLVKEAVPGVTFEMIETPPKPPREIDPLYKKPAPDEDEKIEAEIEAIVNKESPMSIPIESPQESLPTELPSLSDELPPINETSNDNGEVDINIGDKVNVTINKNQVICEVLTIFEEEGQLLVKPIDGPHRMIKVDQIIGLA